MSVSIYGALHMRSLAIRCLEASWPDNFRAITPATIISIVLARRPVHDQLRSTHSIRNNNTINVALMGSTGGLVYALCILYNCDQRSPERTSPLDNQTASPP